MNKAVLLGLGCLFGGYLMLSSTGCKVNLSNAPLVKLDTILGYVYSDTTIKQGTTFTVYVSAIRRGNEDILESGQITRSINGGKDSVLQTMALTSTQFYQFYSYIAGAAGNTERYTFSFGNQNGVSSSVSIMVKDTL